MDMEFKKNQAMLHLHAETVLHHLAAIKKILVLYGITKNVDITELRDITCNDARTIELFDGGR